MKAIEELDGPPRGPGRYEGPLPTVEQVPRPASIARLVVRGGEVRLHEGELVWECRLARNLFASMVTVVPLDQISVVEVRAPVGRAVRVFVSLLCAAALIALAPTSIVSYASAGLVVALSAFSNDVGLEPRVVIRGAGARIAFQPRDVTQLDPFLDAVRAARRALVGR